MESIACFRQIFVQILLKFFALDAYPEFVFFPGGVVFPPRGGGQGKFSGGWYDIS